jgi:hypothetical protein
MGRLQWFIGGIPLTHEIPLSETKMIIYVLMEKHRVRAVMDRRVSKKSFRSISGSASIYERCFGVCMSTAFFPCLNVVLISFSRDFLWTPIPTGSPVPSFRTKLLEHKLLGPVTY